LSEPEKDGAELARLKCFHEKNPAIEHAASTPTMIPAVAPPEIPAGVSGMTGRVVGAGGGRVGSVDDGVKIWYTIWDAGSWGAYTLHTGALGRGNENVEPWLQTEKTADPSVSGKDARTNDADVVQLLEMGRMRLPIPV
jgi:hypothetical protein